MIGSARRWRGLPAAALAALMAGLLAAPALLLHTGCEGTSSGVDNPGMSELTISFRDADGAALRVTGDLDVYAKDQNPAIYPEPMATVKVLQSSLTNLTAEDFERIHPGTKVAAPTKRSAASFPATAPLDSPVAFNLVFRSDARTGSLAFGLVFDPKRRAFLRAGGDLERLDLRPKPVVRFQAQVAREAVHGDLGRVYIPGTPYQATLTDSGFLFEELPEGMFDLRLLSGDGRIFAVKESLDTRASRIFTPTLEPVGRIDSTDTAAGPVRFAVEVGGVREAFVGVATVIEAKVIGVDSADRRAAFLWRQIFRDASDTAYFTSPTLPSTQVKFRKAGVYTLELSATLGFAVARDTLVMTVRDAPAPTRPKVVYPQPGDSLVAGVPVKLAWEMPLGGLAAIEFSGNGGMDRWVTIASGLSTVQGMSFHAWTPPDSLAPSRNCLLRVRLDTSDPKDSLVALMEKPFILLPAPLVDRPKDTLPAPLPGP